MEAWAAAVIQPKSISTGAEYVTPDSIIYCERVKCAGIAQQIGFSALNSCSFP
jgi:hypothetical protein